MVLDNGLNMIGNNVACISYVSVGTGTTAPAASQTALVTYLAQKLSPDTTAASNLGSATYAGQLTYSFIFPQGAVVGNITELGVGIGTSGTNLFSRCLFVDGGNTPTALTAVALDQLTVYYRVTQTPALTDVSSSVTISSVSYSYTGRLSAATSFGTTMSSWMASPNVSFASLAASGGVNPVPVYPAGCTIGAITSNPSGTSDTGTSSIANGTYTNGNFFLDNTLTLPAAGHNPVGGIGGIVIAWGGTGSAAMKYQYVFSTAIPKDNTKTLTLVSRVSWSR